MQVAKHVSPVLAALALLLASPIRAAVTWGSLDTGSTRLVLLIDDSSNKVYMQASGPVGNWFGFGFGQGYMSGYALIFNSSSDGNYFETTIDPYVQPSPQAEQNASAQYCVAGGTIYYSVVRDLQTTDPNDYGFSAGSTSMPMIWAVGTRPFNYHHDRSSTTISTSEAPKPKVNQISHQFGSTTLTITNLAINLTNKLEFTPNLTNWTTISNLVMATPPCGQSLLSFFTNAAVTVPSTNAAGFFRVKQ